MTAQTNTNDLAERVELIESMLAQGRRGQERWGWVYLLWGVAYYAAIAWSVWGPKSALAWPVTMIMAGVATVVVASRKTRAHPQTTLGRAIGSVWAAVGISMFILLAALASQGFLETQVFMAIMAAMLATANAASSLILKWKAQLGCTVIWWVTCGACVMGSRAQATVALLATIFVCQILFGIYCMISDARARRGAVHA